MMKENIFIFDIDGVIRDVSFSYRKSIQLTVQYYTNWLPSMEDIDFLKSEGIYNNDWDLSLELIKRHDDTKKVFNAIDKNDLIQVFNKFYFGSKGYFSNIKSFDGLINNEKLLINREFFMKLDNLKNPYGFVSGSEKESAEFVLKEKLGLKDLNLISMNDAPSKPNPKGLIMMINKLKTKNVSACQRTIFYFGDTVSDTLTVINARKELRDEKIISIGIIPPHLQKDPISPNKEKYSKVLINSGAEVILDSLYDVFESLKKYL